MQRAFVLGNGTSRLQVNCQYLTQYGTVYGCNAIYRDFLPDYLIAVDRKMLDELKENDVQNLTSVWTNSRHNNQYPNFNFIEPSKGWSSGPTALWLASNHDYDEIYILGFDYQGTEDNLINNVYASTPNYKDSTASATFYGNWKKQTEAVLSEFKNVKYYRIVDTSCCIDFEWNAFKNYQNISIEKFKNDFKV
jgi:hypothetical protein